MKPILMISSLILNSTLLAACDQTTNGVLESRAVVERPVGYDGAVVESPSYGQDRGAYVDRTYNRAYDGPYDGRRDPRRPYYPDDRYDRSGY